jgi:hypothetical protein
MTAKSARYTKAVQLRLSESDYDLLAGQAFEERRSLSALAAIYVEDAIAHAEYVRAAEDEAREARREPR